MLTPAACARLLGKTTVTSTIGSKMIAKNCAAFATNEFEENAFSI